MTTMPDTHTTEQRIDQIMKLEDALIEFMIPHINDEAIGEMVVSIVLARHLGSVPAYHVTESGCEESHVHHLSAAHRMVADTFYEKLRGHAEQEAEAMPAVRLRDSGDGEDES